MTKPCKQILVTTALCSFALWGTACGGRTSSDHPSDTSDLGGSGGDAGGTRALGGAAPGGSGGTAARAGSNAVAGADGLGGAGAGGDDAGGSGGEAGSPSETRPECALAAQIKLSGFQSEMPSPLGFIWFSLLAKNNSSIDLTEPPVTLTCTSPVGGNTGAIWDLFVLQSGESQSVSLRIDFTPNATSGQVARCEVRASVYDQTPTDCRNADSFTFDAVVP